MVIRFVTVLLVFYAFVPFDLYIPYHKRIGYFGTDLYEQTISIADLGDRGFFFST